MKYDIFISYKRMGTSSATAAYLYELLQQKGYNVFYDRKEMRSGKFNEQLLEHISNATDIIILLEEESLGSWFRNRSSKKNLSIGDGGSSTRVEMSIGSQEEPYKSDWFCREVMYALSLKGKHIIPILLNGYRMPEGKDLPPEMAELYNYQALSLEISEMEDFYDKNFIEKGFLHSKPANLSLSQRFQSKGGIVGCFLFYTKADSCDLYECGEKILTLTDINDEWHPFRYPVNFAGEHRFKAINNDSCEVISIRSTVETNCQQYVEVQFKETRNLWALTKEEINAQNDAVLLYNWGIGLYDGTSKHEPDIALSYECFNRAINLGSQEALSFVTSHGSGLVAQKQAPDEVAVKWWQIAAEQGNEDAQCNLGNAYFFGRGIEQDYAAAVEWYMKAVEKGHADAQLHLGWMYDNGFSVAQDSAKAFEWYMKAAEQGNAIAQFDVGCSYDKGEGIEQDSAKAFEWYMKAAEQGDAGAQLNLGILYDKGEGVEKDSAKAFKWYMKAAEQGLAKAQYNVGCFYDKGEGVEQDSSKAFEWYIKAAEQGDVDAQYNVGFSYDKGEGVEQDSTKAFEWYMKAAEQGDAAAQYNVGCLYDNGEGVEQDSTKAFEWYMKAAEQGDASAMYMITLIFILKDNYENALLWGEKAIEASPDDPDVVDTLADIYEVIGRNKEAMKLFERCLQLYEDKGNEEGKKETIKKINALKKEMKARQ